MKRFLSINRLLQAITGTMAVVLVVTFASSAEQAWENQLAAERVLAVVSVSRDFFQAMPNLRVERGTINTALAAPEAVDADVRADITALRAKSSAALEAGLAKLPSVPLADRQRWIDELRNARDALARVRAQVDDAMLRPKADRSADLAKSWVATMGKLVDALDGLSEAMSDQIEESDPFINDMMVIKQLAWIVRDAAGTDRLMIGAGIAAGNGLTAEQQKQIATLQGRVEGAWRAIDEDMRSARMPGRLKAAVATAQASYFAQLGEQRRAILADLVGGKAPGVSGADWVKLSNPGLASLIDVAYVAFDITAEFAAQRAGAAVQKFYERLGLAVVFVALGLFATMFVFRRVARPMAMITDAMRTVAQGDLARSIPFAAREDEIGELARALGVFRDGAAEKERIEAAQKHEQQRKEQRQQTIEKHIAAFESAVRALLDPLARAAAEMKSTSASMSGTAEETERQATAVSAAATQASANVQTVATASEELIASIAEISRQVTGASDMARNAVGETRSADATVQGLADAAQRIGEVVQLINDIAAQTNLLALNATIEAARAGDAGKGFAVVASEVKSLATQTAKATDDIASQVGAIQQATKGAVDAIKNVGRAIGKVSEISGSIAAAVEEQGTATQEIARNTQQAARGTHDVSSNIAGVSEGAGQTGAASEQVASAALELNRTSDKLRAEINTFLDRIRAA